jgi:hypothetical protein
MPNRSVVHTPDLGFFPAAAMALRHRGLGLLLPNAVRSSEALWENYESFLPSRRIHVPESVAKACRAVSRPTAEENIAVVCGDQIRMPHTIVAAKLGRHADAVESEVAALRKLAKP